MITDNIFLNDASNYVKKLNEIISSADVIFEELMLDSQAVYTVLLIQSEVATV